MEVVFLGIESEGIAVMQTVRTAFPARNYAISSNPILLRQCGENAFRYSGKIPPVSAISRIGSKIVKSIRDADIIFLFSPISGKKEETILFVSELLRDFPVVSIVWYPEQKHGQHRMELALGRLENHSAVLAFPFSDMSTMLFHISEMIRQIVRMYSLPYVNTEMDSIKNSIMKRGRLHLIQEEICIDHLSRKTARFSPELDAVYHSSILDTLLNYAGSAHLHIVIPQLISQEKISCILECIYLRLGSNADFNFSMHTSSELINSIIIELLASDTITYRKELSWW